MEDLKYLGTCCCCGNQDAYYPVCVDCVPQADCTHGDGPDD